MHKKRTRYWVVCIVFCFAIVSACGTDDSEATFVGQSTRIGYGDDPAQFGSLSIPDGLPDGDGYPVAIVVHGGFWSEPWDYTLMSPLASDLVSRGFATWNIEFRRLGGRGGWPATFDDIDAAIERLAVLAEQYRLDVDRAVVIGHSSGGHLALWALDRPAATVRPLAAIGLAAVVDLEAFPQSERLLGGTIEQVPNRYEAAAPSLDPSRVILVHGENDTIVPPETLAPARANGVPITVVPDTDHFAVIDPSSRSWSATVALIEDLLS